MSRQNLAEEINSHHCHHYHYHYYQEFEIKTNIIIDLFQNNVCSCLVRQMEQLFEINFLY